MVKTLDYRYLMYRNVSSSIILTIYWLRTETNCKHSALNWLFDGLVTVLSQLFNMIKIYSFLSVSLNMAKVKAKIVTLDFDLKQSLYNHSPAWHSNFALLFWFWPTFSHVRGWPILWSLVAMCVLLCMVRAVKLTKTSKSGRNRPSHFLLTIYYVTLCASVTRYTQNSPAGTFSFLLLPTIWAWSIVHISF